MPNSPRRSRLAYYGELSQVGLEMAAPIGVGALIDHWVGWGHSVGAIVGAVFGLVGGVTHLVVLANREDQVEDDKPEGSP
jgi:hypothetical protein